MDAGGARAAAGPAAGVERGRRLARLGAEVGRLRERLPALQDEVRGLAATEARRPLTAAEAHRASRLRLEGEALRLELAGLHEEFERLRAGRRRVG